MTLVTDAAGFYVLHTPHPGSFQNPGIPLREAPDPLDLE